MRDLATYSVSYPYGATDPPYSTAHPHRGNDRACPVGTPVIIGGTTVGLTGNTGLSSGPHCHCQEWSGDYATTREPQNEFKGGTVVNIDPNGTQGDGSFGKFITVQTADGWHDSYCHLSRIDVTIGDIIGEPMEPIADRGFVINRYKQILGRDCSEQEIAVYVGLTHDVVYDALLDSDEFKARLNGNFVPVTEKLFKQKG